MTADGLLLVDKPAGMTSHDVVSRVRRLAGTRRVGHAGTLDPMATGVLVLGINRGTKLLTFLVGADKDYSATIRLGIATSTDDAQGEAISGPGAVDITDEQIRAGVARLTGPIEQVPSSVSAIKVGGQRAYSRVRAGEQVELAARPVTVHAFDVQGVTRSRVEQLPVIDVEVHVRVSSGTYVRALARDLGASLGCGGHLTRLRRTRVGGYAEDQCHTLEGLAQRNEEGALPLLPLAAAAAAYLPSRNLSLEEARALSYGQPIASERPGRTDPVAALGPAGDLVAILDESGERTRCHVVLTPAH